MGVGGGGGASGWGVGGWVGGWAGLRLSGGRGLGGGGGVSTRLSGMCPSITSGTWQ